MSTPGPRERKLMEQVLGLPEPPQQIVQELVDELRIVAAKLAQTADRMSAGETMAIGELAFHEQTMRLAKMIVIGDAIATSTIDHARRHDAEDN